MLTRKRSKILGWPLRFLLFFSLLGKGGALFPNEKAPHAESEGESLSYASKNNPERALKGVVLLGKKGIQLLQPHDLQCIQGLVVLDFDFPGKIETLEKRIFSQNSEGQQLNIETVEKVERIIHQYFIENNRPFLILSTPSQNLEEGVVQFFVQESVVDQITVRANRPSSTSSLMKMIHLKSGDRIDQNKLIRDLNFINQNPFRHADIVYSPGSKEYTTNIEFVLRETNPYRIYAGTDNTGIRTIQRNRMFAGFDFGNFFGLGHVLSCQYIAAYQLHKFQAITAQYLAPLSWQHVLNIYGGYSQVHVDLAFPNKKNHGESYQASFRYQIPFVSWGSWRHDVKIGFDVKGLNNTVEFVETFPLFSRLVNITQAVLSYDVAWEWRHVHTKIRSQIFYSPGQLIANQSDEDFEALRPDAKNHWVYATLAVNQLYKLPYSFLCSISIEGQWSSQNLLPIEQMGIGGYNTVRGYEERELNMDSGVIANLEIRTPPFFLDSASQKKSKIKDGLQFVGFIDYGWGTDRNAVPQTKKRDYLLGAGPGVRYIIDPYVEARLDWGIKLHKEAAFQGGDTMIHFGVTANYNF